MKRVLIVSNYSGYYGSEKMLSYIVESLNKRYNVTLLLNADSSLKDEAVNHYQCDVKIERFNVISQRNKLLSLGSFLFWFRKIREVNPDLIIVNISLIPEVLIASKLLGKPLFVFIRESLIDYRRMFSFYRPFLNFVATRVVCNSVYTRSMFGRNRRNIIIPDIIDSAVANQKGLDCRPTESIAFTYVGRLSERKGIIDLLNAVSLVESKVNNCFKLVVNIVGDHKASDFDYYQSLKMQAESLNADVNFLGYLDEPSQIVSKSNYSICPSKMPETFGLTVLESMALGVPVIARDVGAYSELVKNGKNGLLFDDVESLASAMLESISLSPENYRAMSELCIEESSKYNFDSYQSRLLREVESVIGSGG